eukprot:TRINITY_DN13687_c1_g1_i1.p1 TRINITY_DN13687_c1_g1~~TRINITY_DN13687_c1_g1_i1.p1  ORF type:complete len:367 (+),score=40.55 TRINITY_DN13687_c1_g1_i1:65-1165(+)
MSDSESTASLDNDVSVESFLEDLMHFCQIVKSIGEENEANLTSPVKLTMNSAAEVEKVWTELSSLAKSHEDDATVVTEAFLTGNGKKFRCLADLILPDFHRSLLNWHVSNFYPFMDKFSPEYKVYWEAFLKNCSLDWQTTFMQQLEKEYFLSAYTYSHRIKGDKINSSRISFGASSPPPSYLVKAAADVLESEKITLPEPYADLDGKFKFYGLGWDFATNHLKLYHHGESSDLPDELKAKAASARSLVTDDYEPHCLVAFTYKGNELVEQKLYLYVTEMAHIKDPLPTGTLNAACVLTAGQLDRGTFWQLDVTHTRAPKFDCPEWTPRFGERALEVYNKYYNRSMRLDTLGYAAPDDLTMYFPFEP